MPTHTHTSVPKRVVSGRTGVSKNRGDSGSGTAHRQGQVERSMRVLGRQGVGGISLSLAAVAVLGIWG